MRVLIADPDKTLLSLARRTLEAEGHRVRVASTPQAIEVATADGNLDVAIVDAQLAVKSMSACERLRGPSVRVFVTTALSDGTESIRELLRSGRLPAAERAALRAAGFRYLVLHTSHHPVPDAARQHLFQCLGPPLSEHGSMVVYDFGEGGGAADCSPTVP